MCACLEVLCRLVNKVSPGAIKKVNTSPLAFKQMENITVFLRAIQKLGVGKGECFDTIDLYQAHDLGKVARSTDDRVGREPRGCGTRCEVA